jgi:serine/threonine protein kinase
MSFQSSFRTSAAAKKSPQRFCGALIGSGGMGEVYKARDTRLNRDGAVKMLPEPFADDDDRLRRFQLEAQSAGALNHPNILAIDDGGAFEKSPYLVSEFLEGESLAERLKQGIVSRLVLNGKYLVATSAGRCLLYDAEWIAGWTEDDRACTFIPGTRSRSN